jgi:hypothetical protein
MERASRARTQGPAPLASRCMFQFVRRALDEIVGDPGVAALKLSVIIPSHNPNMNALGQVLDRLRSQSLPQTEWELLVVDNCSATPLFSTLDLSWHRNGELVREEALGLTRARIAGFRRTSGRLVVLVDDDNLLARDYLEQALIVADSFPQLGTWGGDVLPRFERPDLAPPLSLYSLLTLRVVTSDVWSNDPDHHASTPWGAGLCVRREVAEKYVSDVDQRASSLELDLRGGRLVYGGDTDIAYTGCAMGLGKGVFKALQLEHLIPASRCTEEYLCRVAEGRGYSEVLHYLVRTGRLPEVDRSVAGWMRRRRSLKTKIAIERKTAIAAFDGRKRAMRELGESS